jgi:hypothetical protein
MHSVNNGETNVNGKVVVRSGNGVGDRDEVDDWDDNITLIRSSVEVKFPTYNGSLVDGDLVLHIT